MMATVEWREQDVAPLLLLLDAAPEPQAKPPRRQGRRPAKKRRANGRAECCSGCAAALAPVEMAFVWEDAAVCGMCYQRRQAAHILAAVVARRMPGLSTVAEAAAHPRRSWSSAARRFLRRPIRTAAALLR